MTVYADVVFIANFISVIALLLAYSAVFGGRIQRFRLCMTGVVSGIYAVCEAILLLPHIMRMAVLFFLIAIAFGRKNVLYNTARFAFVAVCVEVLFIAVMSIMGQRAFVTDSNVTVFCSGMVGALVYLLSFPLLLIIKKYAKKHTHKKHAEFVINGQKTTLTLLYDSGNLLTHKGVGVAIISWSKIRDLFHGMDYDDFLITAGDRMIYNTVSAGGILPVITPEKSFLDGAEVSVRLAVAERSFGECDGIVGDLNMKGMEIKCSSLKILQKGLSV